MGCANCSSSNGVPKGCGSKGHCLTGGCNKLNTYDWLSNLEIYDPTEYKLVEVSFKNGARKEFHTIESGHYTTGDIIVVDSGSGYDVGKISLSGELVRLQLKKKKIPRDRLFNKVIRIANNRDIEKLEEARAMEKKTMIRARVIARTLDLDMKIGDVEFQADKRKATFYYTAEGRVDFRELVRNYAKEFRIKIEMRQIGSRQESARIGGLGSCGRELCCSTWLSDFRSVSTTAARYQNIAINQTKLSGQCGRLKCCLNYELDTYLEALSGFPKKADYIVTQKGKASLIKMNIFKGLMFYSYIDPKLRGPMVPLSKERVFAIQKMNRNGEKPENLLEKIYTEEEKEIDFADVTGQIELPAVKKSKSRSKSRHKSRKKGSRHSDQKDRNKKSNSNKGKSDGGKSKSDQQKPTDEAKKSNKKRRYYRKKKKD